MASWIAIDPGERRIGIARSDPLGMLAHPAEVAPSVPEVIAWIRRFQEERDVAGVVVGYPLNMDGSVGPIARRSFTVVRTLREALDCPVGLWDERLSSQHVSRATGGAGGRDAPIDHHAAAVILQSYLDAGTPPLTDPPEMDEGAEP